MNRNSEQLLHSKDMKSNFYFLLILTILSLLLSCTETNSSTENDATIDTETPRSIPDETPELKAEKPNCETEGKILDSNEFWASNKNILIRIAATPETMDEEFGDSHRVLQIYDGETCEMIKKEVLPINRSPDFAYYLSDITYNNDSEMVAIRGFDKILVYDVATQKLHPPVKPFFLNQRFAEDAQTGLIKRLEVWEDYLIGYALGMGSFVFDMSSGEPKTVEPLAEFEILEGEDFSTLFLLKSKEDTYQPILPNYDWESNHFKINPMLSEPQKMGTNINKKFKNNRFIILKEYMDESNQRPIAIDMKNRKKIELPAAMLEKKNTEIIEWLKGRE